MYNKNRNKVLVMKLIIQIPCFNEEDTLTSSIEALPKQIDGIDLIETLVIDDGSSDKTYEVANWNGVNHIIRLPRHTGLAGAFKEGLNECLKLGADIIVNTDADNQYNADDIKKLIKPIIEGQADMVIGARPISKIGGFTLFKKILQICGSFIVRLVSSTSVDDAPSGFRAFSAECAMNLNVFDNYTYTMETIIQAKAKGMRVISVPIRVNSQTRKSRLVKNIFSYIQKSAFTILRMFIVYRPFRFFAFFSSIFLIAGFILAARFIYYFLTVGGSGHIQSLILSSILILTGVQTGLIGVLADLSAINRKLLEDIQQRLKKFEKNC